MGCHKTEDFLNFMVILSVSSSSIITFLKIISSLKFELRPVTSQVIVAYIDVACGNECKWCDTLRTYGIRMYIL